MPLSAIKEYPVQMHLSSPFEVLSRDCMIDIILQGLVP